MKGKSENNVKGWALVIPLEVATVEDKVQKDNFSGFAPTLHIASTLGSLRTGTAVTLLIPNFMFSTANINDN